MYIRRGNMKRSNILVVKDQSKVKRHGSSFTILRKDTMIIEDDHLFDDVVENRRNYRRIGNDRD